MPRRDRFGRFLKKGGRRRNTSRRNPTRRNPSRKSNPRKRRRVYRRNPSIALAWSEVRKNLTSKAMLMKYAAGAGGAIVSAKGGSWLYGKAAPYLPAMLMQGTLNSVVQAAFKVATGAVTSLFVPAGYKQAWLIGTGASAVGQLVEPMLPSSLQGLGFGGWLTTGQLRTRGMNGMGGWLTTGQARRLGLAV